MAIFTSFGRRRSVAVGEFPEQELPEEVREALPPRFEAVGEALVAAADTRPACAVVGRDVARDGAALGEALDGLRTTFDLVMGVEPDFASVEALSVAWSEATLEFLHDLSCEDPLTGMASFAHLRTRLDELYREADQTGESISTTHALVVVEMAAVDLRRRAEHQFTRALHLVQVFDPAVDLLRLRFGRCEFADQQGHDDSSFDAVNPTRVQSAEHARCHLAPHPVSHFPTPTSPPSTAPRARLGAPML